MTYAGDLLQQFRQKNTRHSAATFPVYYKLDWSGLTQGNIENGRTKFRFDPHLRNLIAVGLVKENSTLYNDFVHAIEADMVKVEESKDKVENKEEEKAVEIDTSTTKEELKPEVVFEEEVEIHHRTWDEEWWEMESWNDYIIKHLQDDPFYSLTKDPYVLEVVEAIALDTLNSIPHPERDPYMPDGYGEIIQVFGEIVFGIKLDELKNIVSPYSSAIERWPSTFGNRRYT